MRRLALLLSLPLALGAQARPVTGLYPTDGAVTGIVVSADAKRSYYVKGSEVWMLDRDRSTPARVLTTTASDLALSPAGDALAFTRSGARYGSREVWVVPLDGKSGLPAGAERSIGDGDVPAFSPDGKRIAVARDGESGVGQRIVVVTVANRAEREVVPPLPSSVGNIRWTPDGKTLYFGVNPPVACVPDWSCLALSGVERRPRAMIYRASADGGAPELVATVRSPLPGLSPDGRSLVFADTGDAGFVIADIDGRRLGPLPLAGGQSVLGWMSDATLLLRESGTPRRVKLVTLADGQMREILQSTDRITLPAWAPDGKRFSLVWRGPSGIQIRVLDDAGATKGTIAIPDLSVTGTAWSPDGRMIAYTGAKENETARVRVADVATGKITELLDLKTAATSVLQWTPDSKDLIVSEIHGTGATRASTIQQVAVASGATTLLRSIVLGPTPSMTMIVDPKTIALSRAADHDVRTLAVRGDSVERVILGNLTGTTSAPMRGGEWIAVRRSTTTNEAFNAAEVVRLDGSGRRTVTFPFNLAPAPMNPIIVPGAAQLVVAEATSGMTAGRDPVVALVDVATSAVRNLFSYSLRAQMGPVYPELSLSPDGTRLLATYWEVLTPRALTLDITPLRSRR